MLQKTLLAPIAIVLLSLLSTSVHAGNIVTWTGGSDFDTDSIAFAGFTADSLVNITGPAIYHEHTFSNSDTASLAIRLDGVWTTIYSDTITNTTVNLSDIPTPISFTQGFVTGLRLSGSPGSNQTFHGLSSLTTFEFDSLSVASVPEPSSLAILAIGGVVVAGRRSSRRR
ncbi:PEP-CTERM sorting domain-containing protein [Stieleria sp. JC731]|uniref:PEP-CTERM sorting domain-containing protein n=1 Tax=Pirellulaceae TaxID=2691357 RepID=UPI0039656A27